MLISAFRATLEEVIAADVIVHVRDVSHGDSKAQAEDVVSILKDLGVDGADEKLIEVWNKIDRLDEDGRAGLKSACGEAIAVSARTGEGVNDLLMALESQLARDRRTLDVELDGADGRSLHWLYEQAEVMSRRDEPDGRVLMTVRAPPETMARIVRRLG
jgi:GTP-binding protein HflX